MSRAEHDARNAAQLELLRAELGAGYQPAVWCCDPGCHAPYRADLPECPECGYPNLPAILRRVPTRPWPAKLHGAGYSCIEVYRGGHLIATHTWPTRCTDCGQPARLGICPGCLEARR